MSKEKIFGVPESRQRAERGHTSRQARHADESRPAGREIFKDGKDGDPAIDGETSHRVYTQDGRRAASDSDIRRT